MHETQNISFLSRIRKRLGYRFEFILSKSMIFPDVLFSSIGSEFYLKDVKCYIPFNNSEKVTVNFYQVVNSAIKRKEIAVGYYSEAEGGIVLNPKKHKEIEFGKSDRILTLAEEYQFI